MKNKYSEYVIESLRYLITNDLVLSYTSEDLDRTINEMDTEKAFKEYISWNLGNVLDNWFFNTMNLFGFELTKNWR